LHPSLNFFFVSSFFFVLYSFRLDVKTLKLSVQYFGTFPPESRRQSGPIVSGKLIKEAAVVRQGDNKLVFRVTEQGVSLKLTHLLWR
jgi:hypothetical protein